MGLYGVVGVKLLMSPLFSNVSTTLDLNGPTLSFVRDPIGQITDVATGK